jgi:hypothetical protein
MEPSLCDPCLSFVVWDCLSVSLLRLRMHAPSANQTLADRRLSSRLLQSIRRCLSGRLLANTRHLPMLGSRRQRRPRQSTPRCLARRPLANTRRLPMLGSRRQRRLRQSIPRCLARRPLANTRRLPMLGSRRQRRPRQSTPLRTALRGPLTLQGPSLSRLRLEPRAAGVLRGKPAIAL